MANRNKNRRNAYTYSPDEIERLHRVTLPAKLKCSMCLKNYSQTNFSQKQLTDVRWQVSKANRIDHNPKCFKCAGGQLVEIECVMCHKTKGLEAFSKVQRKKPDDATCYACMEIRVTREPVNEATYEDPDKAFIRSETLNSSYIDYFSSASSRDTASSAGEWEDNEPKDGSRCQHQDGGIDLPDYFQHTMSINGSVPGTLIDSELSYTPAKDTNQGAWSEAAGTKSWHTGTVTASSARSGFDPNHHGSPSARSVSGSVHSFASSIAERSQSGTDHVGMRNGFAKIKAYKPEVQEDPFSDDEERESSSDDNDDDDDSDDDTMI